MPGGVSVCNPFKIEGKEVKTGSPALVCQEKAEEGSETTELHIIFCI